MSSAETTTDDLLEALESIKALLNESEGKVSQGNSLKPSDNQSSGEMPHTSSTHFDFIDATTVIRAGKHVTARSKDPHQHLVDDLVKTILPNVERELRAKLHSMTLQELEALLSANEAI